jgi:hypothetical protein
MSKKYKLLKDTPVTKSGAIFEKSDMFFGDYGYLSKRGVEESFSKEFVENNPEWFEEVKDEFEKEFIVSNICIMDKSHVHLKETFETQEQAEAMKELKGHIYKFDEPENQKDFFKLCIGQVSWGIDHYYNIYTNNRVDYNSGTVMNINTKPEERIERIRLLKKAYNIK